MESTNSGNKHVMSILSFVNVHLMGNCHWDRLELVPVLSWFLFCPWLVAAALLPRRTCSYALGPGQFLWSYVVNRVFAIRLVKGLKGILHRRKKEKRDTGTMAPGATFPGTQYIHVTTYTFNELQKRKRRRKKRGERKQKQKKRASCVAV